MATKKRTHGIVTVFVFILFISKFLSFFLSFGGIRIHEKWWRGEEGRAIPCKKEKARGVSVFMGNHNMQ